MQLVRVAKSRLFAMTMKKNASIFAALTVMMVSCTSVIPNILNQREYYLDEDHLNVLYDKPPIKLSILHPNGRKKRMPRSKIIKVVPYAEVRLKPNQSVTLWDCEVRAVGKHLSAKYNGKVLKIDKEGDFYLSLNPDKGTFELGEYYPSWEGIIH